MVVTGMSRAADILGSIPSTSTERGNRINPRIMLKRYVEKKRANSIRMPFPRTVD
jgi:hypothetical protein